MTLDNEDQRKFLLGMFNGVNFPGAVLDEAYATKQAILAASIKKVNGGVFDTEGTHKGIGGDRQSL